MQATLNLPQHNLINDCPTRWGSTFKSLERFLEQERAVRQVLSNDYTATHLIPSNSQLQTLTSIHAALKPVSQLTDMLSGELSGQLKFNPFSIFHWVHLLCFCPNNCLFPWSLPLKITRTDFLFSLLNHHVPKVTVTI